MACAAALCAPASLAAPPSFRAAATAATGGGSTITIARPAGVIPGDVLLAAITSRLPSSATVTQPPGWQLVRRDAATGGSSLVQAVYSKVATSAEPTTYTWRFSRSASASGGVLVFKDIDTLRPVDLSSGAVRTDKSTVTAPSLTTTVADAYVVGFFGATGKRTFGPPAVTTERYDLAASGSSSDAASSSAVDFAHLTPGPTGPKVASTTSASGTVIGQLVALRPRPPDPPLSTAAPSLSGVAEVGSSLVGGPGSWSGTAPITHAYRWQRCSGAACTDIGGATAASYPVSAADIGFSLRLTVVASNVAGSATAVSVASPVVPAPPPPPATLGSLLPPRLSPSTGNHRYVAPDGSDANPGTEAEPWLTIQRGLDALEPGDTLNVRAGAYSEWLHVTRGGTAEAPVTIRAYPEEIVTLTGRLKISASFVRASGLRFLGGTIANATDVLVYVSGADFVELSENELTASSMSAIYTGDPGNGADHFHLIANWIHDNGTHENLDHGVYCGTGTDALIANNLFERNLAYGVHLYPNCDGAVVTANTIVENGRSGVIVGGEAETADGNLVVNNVVAFNAQHGVRSYWGLAAGANNVVRGNVLYGNGAGDLAVDSTGLGLVYEGNTIVDPQFVDRPGRNYRLAAGSGAVDRALPDWSPPIDNDGEARPRGAGADVGAFER